MICRLCKHSVSAKGGNTSNLLMVHHPQRHFEVKKANSKPSGKDKDHTKTGKASFRLFNTHRSGQKYERKSRKWQQLTDAVTYCLAKDMMPIYSVKESFVRLLHSLDSQYELPSRKNFSNVAIPKLYAQTIDDIVVPTISSMHRLKMSLQQKSKAPSFLLQQQIRGPVTLLSHT